MIPNGYERVPTGTVKLLVREDGCAVLELRVDGTILWEGRKITQDQELVAALSAIVSEGTKLYKPVD